MPGGDGLLTNDLDPQDRGPQDACGVFGVWAPREEVAKLTYFGLYALQHRGQESAGIAVAKGSQTMVFKDMGLVSQVFNEATLESLGGGHLAIGHCRYSTTGASVWQNAQPTFRSTATGGLSLGHNGNLTNTLELQSWLAERDTGDESLVPGSLLSEATTDTALITALMATFPGASTEEAAMQVFPRLRGAFCLVFMDDETLYAARDPQGIRPLVLGRLESGWVVASETAALDIVGASFVREVAPGELISVDENGLRSRSFATPDPKGCLFEYVYLARPDTLISGRRLHSVRVEVGRTLAKEHPVEADLVIPVPESGTPAAIGYAEASGIPYGQGLVKNSYVGRTFIQPSQTIRQLGIRLKLNPLRDVIAGQRLVVVDDSIVRGNTQRALVRMLREAGAAEIHVRISSPPVKWPCFYGIDFASRAELIATGLNDEEICRSIGADSLGYVSLDGLVAATDRDSDQLCRACFDGVYPVELPLAERLGKSILEDGARLEASRNPAGRAADGLESVVAGVGAADAPQPAVTPTQQGGRPPWTPATTQSAYAAAGVDIAAGDRAVELMKSSVARTRRPEVLGGLGGFAGFFDARALARMDHPVLATSTDGVGTKVAIAAALGVHDTIGFDLVGMVVDDLVVTGAEPLFMTDYIACGRVVPERVAAIVKGIAEACVEAGCALLGGETAEHPGLLGPDEYDVAGAATGVVERDRILGPDRVRPGDVVVALESSGLHSNGYSLVRHVLAGAGWSLDRYVDELGRTVGEELLVPTRIYARDCLALVDAVEVHAMSHVTGGGLANNLARVVPASCTVTIERGTWVPAPVFGLVGELGQVPQADLEATLNLGVGMVALLPGAAVGPALELLAGRGLRSWVCGSVEAVTDRAAPRVELVGSYR